MYQDNRKIPGAAVDRLPSLSRAVTSTGSLMWFLNHPHHPRFLYQLSLTGNMSGPYLRGEERGGEEKTEESTYRDLQTDQG